MNKSYFKEYYSLERNHWWFKAREKLICKKIEKHIFKSKLLNILNVGAATGATSEMLEKYGRVLSLEKDKDCCQFLKDNGRIKIIEGDATNLSLADHTFDMVCAFDVIEHIEDHEKALKEMARVCKEAGHIIITVPAGKSLWGSHDVVNHHIRRYSKKEIITLFNELVNGKIIYFMYFNNLLYFPLLLFRFLNRKRIFINDNGAGSDFTRVNSKTFNNLLSWIFFTDVFLNKYIKFPFGSSMLLIWRKNK